MNTVVMIKTLFVGGVAALMVASSVSVPLGVSETEGPASSYIVQADSLSDARAAVLAADGEITHELSIIRAVGARISQRQLARLRAAPGLRIHADAELKTAGGPVPDAEHVKLIGADQLHAQGIDGQGVTVAVLDTGMWYSHNNIKRDLYENNKIVAEYDAQEDEEGHAKDKHGHGTHLTSIIASSQISDHGNVHGIAPNVNLVNIKAFGVDGSGSYADVIRGLDWLVANKDNYNIRVVNLSFSATPQSHYWDDPINQAVMATWQAGIVVVASAGNGGPDPMTIGVPGNVPYVITVGAMSDNYTPGNASDDVLASFSAAGPTVEGFVKPEVVAPGGHMLGIMDDGNHQIADDHPEWVQENARLYVMSGTSQSAAVVTGAAALLLQAKPWLTPDEVKCQLMSSARPAVDTDGRLAYSVFQQGAGMINAFRAVQGGQYDCANRGLDIDLDLAG
ncbi:MAG: S8 family peptidase, partial [Gammaproteobacteria bacterium]